MNSSEHNSYIVGIGASAGGLEALESFFKAVPIDSGNVYIVVQHLSPDYKSLMNELLSRVTKLPIHIIKDGMETKPNNIYLIPPRHNLSVYHSRLFLLPWKSKKVLNFPIDEFLDSLAKDQGKKAIAIILSGTGSDGSMGIKSIKENGGIVMVQNPESAKFDGMPKNAIDTGMADYVMEVEKMPDAIRRYINNPVAVDAKKEDSSSFPGLDNLAKIALILRNHCGIDFSYYKENTLIRRIERRIQVNDSETLEKYIDYLRTSSNERDILFRELLIGVTNFFRDNEAYDCLLENVIPNLDYSKKMLRIWVAGCSTGEEAYSIAMILMNYIEKNNIDCDFRIFATDIDKHSLEVAGSGRYPESSLADMTAEQINKYFKKKESFYIINTGIREKVVFARHNLIKDPPFSKLDMISCRNLFIYLKPEIQQDVMQSFYYALEGKNYMFLGSSETVGSLSNAFETIDKKWKLYKANPAYSTKSIGGFGRRTLPRITQYNFHERKIGKTMQESNRIFKEIVSELLPPSILVNGENRIVQVINDIKPFMEISTGVLSDDASSVISSQLFPFVNNLLRKLRKTNEEISFSSLTSIKQFEGKELTIKGKRINSSGSEYFLISFIMGDEITGEMNVDDIPENNLSHIKELEERLQSSKENLQATVEELETSNEELQSSNEELIASNEELQSTNEELQSVNEELYTVNNEYQKKIDELTLANSDFNNLIKNTGLGAIYIDRKNIIRRITAVVPEITNISDEDIGRPIRHFKFMDGLQDIEELVNRVNKDLQPIELTVKDSSNRYWLTTLKPYRTKYNSVEGVTITLVDISELTRERALTGELEGKLKGK